LSLTAGSVVTVTTITTNVNALTSSITVSILVVTVETPSSVSGAFTNLSPSAPVENLTRVTFNLSPATPTLILTFVRTAPVVLPPVLFLTPAAPGQLPHAALQNTEYRWSALDIGYFIVGDEPSFLEANQPPRQKIAPEPPPPVPPREEAPAVPAALASSLLPTAEIATEEFWLDAPLPAAIAPPVGCGPVRNGLALSALLAGLLGFAAVHEPSREQTRQPSRRARLERDQPK
jgi:hypothetical protein